MGLMPWAPRGAQADIPRGGQPAGGTGRQAHYSQDGPAQVVGCAAPVHGVVQDVKREGGHSCLLEDPEVITCGQGEAGLKGHVWPRHC